MKVLYIYIYKDIFDFKKMGLKLICQKIWVARARAIWLAVRGVIGSHRTVNCLLASIFVGIENGLTAHSWVSTTVTNNWHPQVNQELPCCHNYEEEEGCKVGKDEYRGRTSITLKVGEIDKKIREGKSRSMRKDMVGLYYLAHIASYLVLSQFWWLVPVFSIVYRWWTPVEVSSETPIYGLTMLFHLSVFPPSICCLMMVWKILNSALSVDMGSGIVTWQ